MKKLFILLAAVVLLSGCAEKLTDHIPVGSFKKVSTIVDGTTFQVNLTAQDSKMIDGIQSIEYVDFYTTTPFVNIHMILEGYERKVKE